MCHQHSHFILTEICRLIRFRLHKFIFVSPEWGDRHNEVLPYWATGTNLGYIGNFQWISSQVWPIYFINYPKMCFQMSPILLLVDQSAVMSPFTPNRRTHTPHSYAHVIHPTRISIIVHLWRRSEFDKLCNYYFLNFLMLTKSFIIFFVLF